MKFITGSRTSGKKIMLAELFLLIAMAPSLAIADPNIQLDMIVAKEIVIEQDGQQVTQWVEAESIEPGETLRYTVRYINVGDDPATDIRIENPVPELTVYISDSASGEGSTIVFSADDGENYSAKEEVTYEVAVFGGGTDKRQASAERYTNIRWLIDEVNPGSAGEVSFEVTVQ
jgi:uncharacterized repeat protein (TIGR01451 family)